MKAGFRLNKATNKTIRANAKKGKYSLNFEDTTNPLQFEQIDGCVEKRRLLFLNPNVSSSQIGQVF